MHHTVPIPLFQVILLEKFFKFHRDAILTFFKKNKMLFTKNFQSLPLTNFIAGTIMLFHEECCEFCSVWYFTFINISL
jgi:hypothetical protein